MHDRFERLARSDDVNKERKCRLLGGTGGCSVDPYVDIAEPKDDFADIAQPVLSKDNMSSFRALWNRAPREEQEKFLKRLSAEERTQFGVDMGWAPKAQSQSDPYANLPDTTIGKRINTEYVTPLASELDGKEIKTINWGKGKDYAVESIETEDGDTLHATPPPSRLIYFWAVIFPLLGFVIPWGLIRSIRWVAAGFLVNQESK